MVGELPDGRDRVMDVLERRAGHQTPEATQLRGQLEMTRAVIGLLQEGGSVRIDQPGVGGLDGLLAGGGRISAHTCESTLRISARRPAPNPRA